MKIDLLPPYLKLSLLQPHTNITCLSLFAVHIILIDYCLNMPHICVCACLNWLSFSIIDGKTYFVEKSKDGLMHKFVTCFEIWQISFVLFSYNASLFGWNGAWIPFGSWIWIWCRQLAYSFGGKECSRFNNNVFKVPQFLKISSLAYIDRVDQKEKLIFEVFI